MTSTVLSMLQKERIFKYILSNDYEISSFSLAKDEYQKYCTILIIQ